MERILPANQGSLEFFYDGQGFMSVQLHQDQADFIFYDVDGNILYQHSQWSLRKSYLPSSYIAEAWGRSKSPLEN